MRITQGHSPFPVHKMWYFFAGPFGIDSSLARKNPAECSAGPCQYVIQNTEQQVTRERNYQLTDSGKLHEKGAFFQGQLVTGAVVADDCIRVIKLHCKGILAENVVEILHIFAQTLGCAGFHGAGTVITKGQGDIRCGSFPVLHGNRIQFHRSFPGSNNGICICGTSAEGNTQNQKNTNHTHLHGNFLLCLESKPILS